MPRDDGRARISFGGRTISRHTRTSTIGTCHTPAELLSRAGIVGVVLFGLCAATTLAQDAPKTDPNADPKKAEPAEPPTNDPAEIMRRMRRDAEKLGIKPEAPGSKAPAPENRATEGKVESKPAGKQPATKPPPTPIQPPVNPAQPPKPANALTVPQNPAAIQPGMQPNPLTGANPGAAPGSGVTAIAVDASNAVQGENFHFDFTEPVDLTVLVTYVRDALGLQIIFTDGGLAGQKVYLNSPVTVKKDQVLYFVSTLLEQKDYTLYQDLTGIYFVSPKAGLPAGKPGTGAFSTTRIIRTPNIKPSSLQTSISNIITASRGNQAGASQPIYMDELGLIMLTESPRVTQLVEEFVNTLVQERNSLKFFRFELQNISAAAARDRILELLGQQQQARPSVGGQPGQPVPANPVGVASATITNLGERLTIDPTSNSMFLRGREDERTLLATMLPIIDLPNGMVSKWYPVGNKTAEAVAFAGTAEQLGGVTTYQSSDGGTTGGGGAISGLGRQGVQPGLGGQQNSSSSGTGAGFVIYPEAGGFIYRGTEAQHTRVGALVASMSEISYADLVTYEFYKLKHGKAEEVAEVIQNLLTNSSPTGNRPGGLLGSDLGSRSRSRTTSRTPRQADNANAAAAAGSAGAGGSGIADLEGADVFVLADEPNNQVIVKAPAKLQRQFRDLIMRIDLRRPQVYIDAKIVAVNEGDDFRLAVEAQQIIGQFAFNTNFGLGSLTTTTGGTTPTTTGGITSPKNVATSLPGITAALVRSKDVPFIVTALARDTNSRIIASPQLLVDDNTEAEVSSIEQQATATTTQTTGNPAQTSFGGYEDAGPKLTVKPQISDGGYLRMEYALELSTFTGASSANLPPPRQKNELRSESVTVPSDSTIVIGGLTLENVGKTVIKVPLLGDIPIFGVLFRDETTNKRRTTLYAFITPKIMRDPSFADLRLLTKGPLALVGEPGEFPEPKAERIDILDTAKFDTQNTLDDEAKKNEQPEPISPEKGTPVRRDPPQRTDEPY